MESPAPAPSGLDGARSCRVTEVVDGDTVTLECPGRPAERARLTGFDTPELFSPECPEERASAMQAKGHLGHLIRDSGRLSIVWQGRDHYGRALVAMSVDGSPVAREMIDAGLARAYEGGRRQGWCGSEPATTARAGTGTLRRADDAAGRGGTGSTWLPLGG